MGNSASPQNISNNKTNNVSSIIELNDDKIFNTISDISNRLFMEYNNLYLKNDFCSKLSILYEKKLLLFILYMLLFLGRFSFSEMKFLRL